MESRRFVQLPDWGICDVLIKFDQNPFEIGQMIPDSLSSSGFMVNFS
jgi:hypothetical protein